jgi:c(7)-type cytochrome triheme protein
VKKAKNFISRPETSAPLGALVVFTALFLASCSHKSLGLFFDLPPPKPEAETAEPVEGSAQAPTGNGLYPGYGSHRADRETDRPVIESVADWEAALALLPTNKKGEPDWSAALREGIVEPRALDPADRMAEFFKLDFFIRAEKPKNDAWFPHSSHLAWMGCDSCHPAVFKYAENEMTMKAMRGGEGCGACHGSVAFTLKDCKRCHTQK